MYSQQEETICHFTYYLINMCLECLPRTDVRLTGPVWYDLGDIVDRVYQVKKNIKI